MVSPQLLSESDVQQALAQFIRKLRERRKLSREALSERSTVPAATIKKFELTGQISLRQWLLLWQSLDDLRRVRALTEHSLPPASIDEVLSGDI